MEITTNPPTPTPTPSSNQTLGVIVGKEEATSSIDALYDCIGAESSWLGYPKGPAYIDDHTGKPRQEFQNGIIGWVSSWNHYYAASTRSIYDLWLAPESPVCVQGLNGQQLSIANTYNRIGGQLTNLAAQNNLEVEVALAVWQVEAGGGSFGSDGRPIIRFENHILWDLWGVNNQSKFNEHFRFNNTGDGRGRDKDHYIRGSTACPGPRLDAHPSHKLRRCLKL